MLRPISMIRFAVMGAMVSGCGSMFPAADKSVEQRIASELATQPVTKPSKVSAPGISSSVLSDLIMPSINNLVPTDARKGKDQRFDLVVTEAPISQVLASLVEGTDYSMLLKLPEKNPTAEGKPVTEAVPDKVTLITLNLKNVTLFEALDSIREVYGYDYTVEGARIVVAPSQLQTRLFHVNYIIGQRKGVSDLQVIAGAASSGGGSAGGFGAIQASGLSTAVKSDIWGEAEDSLRTVLGCNIPKLSGATGGAGNAAAGGGGAASSGGSAGGANSSRADVKFPGESNLGERTRGVDGCKDGRALTINPMSGTILARGMPSELRLVEKMLKSMQLSISRQVIIEAKIVDVELNSDSQQGINWSAYRNGLHRFSVGANAQNITVNQASPTSSANSGGVLDPTLTLGGLLGNSFGLANSAVSQGMGVALQGRNFAAMIEFLETQGRVHVLSSPRISTMNNQKAVIKVGNEESFVTNINGGSSTSTGGGTPIVTPPTLIYQPFFSGIALDVTPQIDDNDQITLHVHSVVNSVIEKPKLALPNSSSTVPFAVNNLNETDSVVRAQDGQMIVIGGLMTEKTADTRGGVPGARDVPVVGGLFNRGAQSSVKRELVILLKPTVVKGEEDWSKDIGGVTQRLETLQSPSSKR